MITIQGLGSGKWTIHNLMQVIDFVESNHQ